MVDEDRIAAHGVDAGLEGQAGAQARFFKHEHHLLGVERVAILAGIALDVVAQLHEGAHFGAGKIGDGAEIFAGHARGRGKDIGILLHGNASGSLRSMVVLLAMMVTSRRRVVRRSVDCEDFVERGDGRVDVSALENVRRQEAQHGVAGAVDKDVALHHFGYRELGKLR